VAAAINRVSFHEQLETRQVPVHPDIMVLGGGHCRHAGGAGHRRAGHKVYLVEKQPTIGGHMLQFDKTFPTLDCAACIGTPKMVEVAQQANIELLTYSEVTEVIRIHRQLHGHRAPPPALRQGGSLHRLRRVRQGVPGDQPAQRVGCGIRQRRAIYRAFPQAVPIAL
jgi:heterodisulfide reductase subunit A2